MNKSGRITRAARRMQSILERAVRVNSCGYLALMRPGTRCLAYPCFGKHAARWSASGFFDKKLTSTAKSKDTGTA